MKSSKAFILATTLLLSCAGQQFSQKSEIPTAPKNGGKDPQSPLIQDHTKAAPTPTPYAPPPAAPYAGGTQKTSPILATNVTGGFNLVLQCQSFDDFKTAARKFECMWYTQNANNSLEPYAQAVSVTKVNLKFFDNTVQTLKHQMTIANNNVPLLQFTIAPYLLYNAEKIEVETAIQNSTYNFAYKLTEADKRYSTAPKLYDCSKEIENSKIKLTDTEPQQCPNNSVIIGLSGEITLPGNNVSSMLSSLSQKQESSSSSCTTCPPFGENTMTCCPLYNPNIVNWNNLKQRYFTCAFNEIAVGINSNAQKLICAPLVSAQTVKYSAMKFQNIDPQNMPTSASSNNEVIPLFPAMQTLLEIAKLSQICPPGSIFLGFPGLIGTCVYVLEKK